MHLICQVLIFIFFLLAEIVFPGRPGNSGSTIVKPARIPGDSSSSNVSHPTYPNEVMEPGIVAKQNDKMHPFGLLWSELEGSHSRKDQASNNSFCSGAQDQPIIGRNAVFGATAESSRPLDSWPDMFRRNAQPEPNMYHDVMDAQLLPRMDQETNRFDVAEKLLSQRYLQYPHQHGLMPSHDALLDDAMLERGPSQNLMQQQLSGQVDLEQILAFQQQQRLLQLQQHQQLQQQQQQQQQLHQQQMLLKEQQAHARKMLLEQFMQNQMGEPARGQSRADILRPHSAFMDQALLNQQILSELHQRPHLPPRHPEPSLEHLIQAKFGQLPSQVHPNDLLELLSRAKHGQLHPLEHQILQQEQLQGRQLPTGLRQRRDMEEDRLGSVWPVEETSQFLRNPAVTHRANSAGFSPLDLFHQQQIPSPEEQLSHLQRNLSFQDRLQQGHYDPSLMQFERSMSLPVGGAGANLEVINSIARAQGLDMQEMSARMHPVGQAGGFSPGVYSHHAQHPLPPNQYRASNSDPVEGHWFENNGQVPNEWMDSRMQQQYLNSERQKRDLEVKRVSEDPSLWMSAGTNDDSSKRLLMELLHQKSGQSAEPVDGMNGLSSERKTPVSYSVVSSLNHPFSLLSNQEASVDQSLAAGSYIPNSVGLQQDPVADEVANATETVERMGYRSNSETVLAKGEAFFSGGNEPPQVIYMDFPYGIEFDLVNCFLDM